MIQSCSKFSLQTFIGQRKYQFPADCYGYFCPTVAVEKTKLHRFSVETEWTGLVVVSNILVVTLLVTMSSKSVQNNHLLLEKVSK